MKITKSRREYIRDELSGHLLDQSVAVVAISADVWQAQEGLGDRFRFGWMPGTPMDEDELLFVMSISPELIDKITQDLSNAELTRYLEVIKLFLDDLVATAFDESPAEVMRRTEEHLYATAPDELALLSRVEANALDNGLVPSGSGV